MNNDMTLAEAADYMGVTRQAVYVALKAKKMSGYKKNGVWFISQKEIEGYMGRRYSRTHSILNGKPRFDKNKGELCTREVADHLNIPMQRAYYLMRTGVLKSFRKESSYVILVRDLEEAKKILNNNRNPELQVRSYGDQSDSQGQSGSVGSS